MKRAGHQPETIGVSIYAGIYCKLWTVPDKGTLVPQHAHEHPHLTVLMKGAVEAWCDEEWLGVFHAPYILRVPAFTMHRFLTLTPDTRLACIHNADHLEADEPAVSQEARLELED